MTTFPDDPTASPCLTGGNALYYYASVPSPWLTPTGGPVTGATWTVRSSFFTGGTPTPKRLLFFEIETSTRWWNVVFSTTKVATDLTPGVYEDAMRVPFEAVGHPGFNLTTGSRGCNEVFARFEIVTLKWAGTELESFTALFSQRCDYNPNISRGCIHYERTD